MEVSLLSPEDPTWQQEVEAVAHDFYHLPGYCALEAERLGGRATLVRYAGKHGRVLVPLVVRPVSVAGKVVPDAFDATSPYGYPCPLYVGEAAQRVGAEFLRGFREVLQAEGVCSVFLRLHPLLQVPPEIEEHMADQGTVHEHGETVYMDLTRSEEEQFSEVRSRWRTLLRKYRRTGPTARMDDDLVHYERFIDLYYQTMDQAGARREYYFSRPYFLRLRQVLGERLRLCVVDEGGGPSSAILLTICAGIAQYHLAANSLTDGCRDGPKIAIDGVRQWASANDCRVLHLGGGLGGSTDDSLFYFKSGFSKRRATFKTWRFIVDPQRYSELVTRWEGMAASAVDDASTGFFPAYRRPLPDERREV